MIDPKLIEEARRLADIAIIPGNTYNPDVLAKIDLAKALVEVLDAVYVQDCHISGMHDPCHTPHYICQFQLRDMAMRVLSVTHGVDDWDEIKNEDQDTEYELRYIETNKVPRRLYRGEDGGWSWFNNYVERHAQGKDEGQMELYANWEKNGCIPEQK